MPRSKIRPPLNRKPKPMLNRKPNQPKRPTSAQQKSHEAPAHTPANSVNGSATTGSSMDIGISHWRPTALGPIVLVLCLALASGVAQVVAK